MSTIFLYEHRGYTRIGDVAGPADSVKFTWQTKTPAADLHKMHLVLRPWHVSSNLYALSPTETYHTLLRKFPSLASVESSQQYWRRVLWQSAYSLVMLFAVILCGVLLGALASVLLTAIIGAVLSLFRR